MGLFGGTRVVTEEDRFNVPLAYSQAVASGRDFLRGISSTSISDNDREFTISAQDAFGQDISRTFRDFDSGTRTATVFNTVMADLDRQYRDSATRFAEENRASQLAEQQTAAEAKQKEIDALKAKAIASQAGPGASISLLTGAGRLRRGGLSSKVRSRDQFLGIGATSDDQSPVASLGG